MKTKHTRWFQRYQTALRTYLEHGPDGSLQPALKLGTQAAALGLETLDLAGFHEQVLLTLNVPKGSSRAGQHLIERTKVFFDETIAPLEKTHGAALKADKDILELNRTLRKRGEESTATTRKLEQGIAQRQAAEAALKKSRKENRRLIQESARLQNRLREQTREMLSAQNDECGKTSRRLQDEIAQTLVAIQLSLLALKKPCLDGRRNLSKEIAATQRMVRQFEKTIHRLTNETGHHHET